MRLQHRKLLTPVNAQFLNNTESWLQEARRGEDACSPNNGILKVHGFVRDVINIIHPGVFFTFARYRLTKPQSAHLAE